MSFRSKRVKVLMHLALFGICVTNPLISRVGAG